MKKLSAAHSEGFVSLVRNKHQQFNSKIYSCGNGEDNSIAIWEFKDDDFFDRKVTVNLKERCTGAFACYGHDLFVGVKHKNKQNVTQYTLFRYTLAGNNAIEADLQIASFTEKILSVDVSSNGVYVIAGSSDHNFKCLRINSTDSKYTQTKTHELNGAVVHISIDPTSTNYVVSSSDGLVSVFPVEDIDGTFDILETATYQICNSFKPEDGQARLRTCWSPSGDELFIPAEGHIKVISTDNWNEKHCIYYTKSPLNLFGSVIYCRDSLFAFNNKDQLACFDLVTLKTTYEKEVVEIEILKKDVKGPYISSIAFIEDGYLAIAAKTGDIYKHKYETLPADAVMLDEDESSVAKLKSQYGFNEDLRETPRFTEQPFIPIVNTKPAVLIEKARTREILVSGQAKESNDFSCLKWNTYGYVFDRVVDGERSIEVKFHNASVHEEIALDNQISHYIFADLNNSLLALASQKNGKDESELYVRQINAWDRENQVWTTVMPNGETIEAIAVGEKFVSTYSDLRFIRIYSATGILRFIFSATGPLRSLVAGGNSLCLVRDTGSLIIEDAEAEYERRYVIDLYNVNPLSQNVLTPSQKSVSLPLSPECDLNWISFTPAGNLCTMDSLFVVRYLAPNDLWVPVFVGADVLKNPDDAIWPISLIERPTPRFRYIYCREREKPNLQKTEIPVTAEWNIPIENKETEKGKLEHDLILNELLQAIINSQQPGFNVVDYHALAREHSKTIMLLFGLCCKKKRDARAIDVATLTNQQNLGLLQNYAAKSDRPVVTNKIGTLFNEKSMQSALDPCPSNSQASELQNDQPERRVQLQKKRMKATLTSALVGSSLNSSISESFNMTPLRNEKPLPDISNTQDSLISFPDTQSMDRKRNFEAPNSGKAIKKPRTSNDFFDSLAD